MSWVCTCTSKPTEPCHFCNFDLDNCGCDDFDEENVCDYCVVVARTFTEQSKEKSRAVSASVKIKMPKQAVEKKNIIISFGKKGCSSKDRYTCNKCDKMVADKYNLVSHIKENHLKGSHSVKLTACPQPRCTYKDRSEAKVFKHINKVHYKKRREKKHDGANSQAETPSTSAPTATTPQQMHQDYGQHQVVYQHHPQQGRRLRTLDVS